MQTTPLNVVIREALAEKGAKSLREAEELTGITKDKISRRYRGVTPWTTTDLEKVADALGITVSELAARAEVAA